jgi:Ca-dependent carbohydrate-binding module xylan-binding
MRKLLILLPILLLGFPAVAQADIAVEAESMSVGTGMEVRTTPFGHMAFLANSGTNGARETVSTGDITALKLQAWQKQVCGTEPARAQVLLDGVLVSTVDVAATSSMLCTVNVSRPAGSHTLEVRFNNDFGTNRCDRNLYLDKTTVVETAVSPPTAAFTVTPANPVVGQTTTFDWAGTCPAGPCAFMWENEYADGPEGGNDVLWGTTDPLDVT